MKDITFMRKSSELKARDEILFFKGHYESSKKYRTDVSYWNHL